MQFMYQIPRNEPSLQAMNSWIYKPKNEDPYEAKIIVYVFIWFNICPHITPIVNQLIPPVLPLRFVCYT